MLQNIGIKTFEIPKKIILIGFRTVGKTTISRLLAKKINYECIDLDEVINKRTQKTVAEITRNGANWSEFRKIEHSVLEDALKLDNVVISAGGGVGVNDILIDMLTKPRLMDGRGNAMLVSYDIYEACKIYELFEKTPLKGKCAIITSYQPSISDIKGKDSGEGETKDLLKYGVYKKMLVDYFEEDEKKAMAKVSTFEKQVKEKFVKEPMQMKLLIVVDKLLTGFDAPSATYLYIDKPLRDHGLFQAICRVNRLDGEDKEYGYIVDYKDLFHKLEGAIDDYTSGALDGYEADDVKALLTDRLVKAKERLDEVLETIRALCEPVEPPMKSADYRRYFVSDESRDVTDNEPKRVALYKNTASLIRAYANIASEMIEAGYTESESIEIKKEVAFYDKLRDEIKLASGDYIDMKLYETAMRHLIDQYIRAEESETLTDFDEMGLIQLIVEQGVESATKGLPTGIKSSQSAMAETIENNMRKLIIDENPINPKYYDKMSELLDALIKERKEKALEYKAYLEKIQELSQQVMNPMQSSTYPKAIDTRAKQALFDNLESDEVLAIAIDSVIKHTKQDGWIGHTMKERKVKIAIKKIISSDSNIDIEKLMEIIKKQDEYS